jgi:hypothetical protein
MEPTPVGRVSSAFAIDSTGPARFFVHCFFNEVVALFLS